MFVGANGCGKTRLAVLIEQPLGESPRPRLSNQ